MLYALQYVPSYNLLLFQSHLLHISMFLLTFTTMILMAK